MRRVSRAGEGRAGTRARVCLPWEEDLQGSEWRARRGRAHCTAAATCSSAALAAGLRTSQARRSWRHADAAPLPPSAPPRRARAARPHPIASAPLPPHQLGSGCAIRVSPASAFATSLERPWGRLSSGSATSTCCTRRRSWRRASTSLSARSPRPTRSSWTSSARAATTCARSRAPRIRAARPASSAGGFTRRAERRARGHSARWQSDAILFLSQRAPPTPDLAQLLTVLPLSHPAGSFARPRPQCALSPPRSTTVFSHAQTVVICGSCSTVLCQPTGGKARLTEGCSFRKKSD